MFELEMERAVNFPKNRIVHLWRISPSRGGVSKGVMSYYISSNIRGLHIGSSAGIKIVIGKKDP